MGRRLSDELRPGCPKGHDGRVRLHGRRYRADGRTSKPRFLCVPATGDHEHTFSLSKVSPTHAHVDGITCATCERDATRLDGSTVVGGSSFALVEVARLLLDVGSKTSLRKASRRLRIETDHEGQDATGRRYFSTQNALAADYLDRYGPVVAEATRPVIWPRILVVDSLPMEMRVRDPDQQRLGIGETSGGAVLVASGKEDPSDPSIAWHAQFRGGESGNDWWEFLHTLPTDPAPEWIVADGAKAIRAAVAETWPNAVFFPCLYHLGERAKMAAKALMPKDAALLPAVEVALTATHQWDRLIALAKPHGDTTLWQWITANDALVRSLDGLRRRLPGAPEGNGAAESFALELRERIGCRKSNFTNARRLNTLVELMRADVAGTARTMTYLRALRGDREAAGWTLGHGDRGFWERGHDPFGQASVADAIKASRDRSALDFSMLLVASQTRSVQAKVVEDNVGRVAAGLPALVATVASGAKVASVKVRGTWLRDYPEVMRDWDPSNDRDPLALPAGSGYDALWTCVACGHQWRVEVSQRTIRRTRCAKCRRPWGIQATSLATTHPDLVEREWVREANLPRLPEVITARSADQIIWRCPNFPGIHPDYPMSPRARVNADIGCPACRQIRSAARRRKPRPDDPRLP